MHLLGETLDDAAGEALDKGARMLGLGFPGGPAISKAAAEGDPTRHDFPVGLKDKKNLDFSFSGLKTSLLYKLKALDETQVREELPHLAASYEAAVVEALVRKLLRAAEQQDASTLVVARWCRRQRLAAPEAGERARRERFRTHRAAASAMYGQCGHDRGRRAPHARHPTPGISESQRPKRLKAYDETGRVLARVVPGSF